MPEVGQVVTLEPEDETGRPVVLQVLPALVAGGVERSTVDIAQALKRAGGTAIVASEGGPMELELLRAGVQHIKLPLASKNPMVILRNVRRLERLIRQYDVDIVHARSRAPAWSAFYAARRDRCRLRHHLSRHLQFPLAAEAPLQRDHGPGRAGDRELRLHRPPHPRELRGRFRRASG